MGRTTHGMTHHRLYNTWVSMLKRTSNPNSPDYDDYGAKGIKVCKDWEDIKVFIEDMYPSFIEGMTIDRIDNTKGYSKDNCRWASNFQQKQNTTLLRSTNTSGYRGVSYRKERDRWQAQISHNNKYVRIGASFHTAEEAAIAYNNYVIVHSLEQPLNIIL